MGRSVGVQSSSNVVTNVVPIGAYASVFRQSNSYKSVGESIQRSLYPDFSAEFPRDGSFASIAATLPKSQVWTGAAYGKGVFVAVGQPEGETGSTDAAYSEDGGKTWYASTMPSNVNWQAVAFGNGIFVAIAYSSDSSHTATSACATSTDGKNWIAATMVSAQNWKDIIYEFGMFIAVAATLPGTTVAATSANGATASWTARTLPASGLWNSLASNGTTLIAMGGTGTVAASSTNGTTWTLRAMPASGGWNSCAYGNGKFLASGGTPVGFATSTDGISWSAVAAPSFFSSPGKIEFGNGVFLFGANVGTLTCLVVSVDGTSWSVKATFPAGSNVKGANLYAAGRFIAFRTGSTGSSAVANICYAENLTDSDYVYLTGTAGQFIRVK